MRLSLQTKILVLVLSLVLFIIILLTASFTYLEAKEIEKQKAQLALKISKTISFMPEVIEALQTKGSEGIIQPTAERIREEIGAEFIVVGNKEGIRYSHPVPERIGEKMVGEDNYRALVEEEYYTSRAVGSLGPSLRGKSPIFSENGQVIGIVSVGFLMKDIKEQIFHNVLRVSFKSLIVLLLAVAGSVMLSRNIRKDTMGLEPYQIATLHTEKDAILQSTREGLLSYDEAGRVTMMNQTAKKLLNISGGFRHLKIENLLPSSHLYQIFKTGKPQMDQELLLEDKTLIINRTPIFHKDQVKGVVASFRDKTEIEQMLHTISEVKSYSEDLRAQTHEFTNKLYVLSSLLQLGEYEEAVEMIQNETANVEVKNRILFNQIEDSKVQAILLGKIGKASEKKIGFEIDSNSSLQGLPSHINLTHLIVIIGNLVDNAFEAVANHDQHPQVTFFATDLGNDIIFEIHDNGAGIPEENKALLFNRGFTDKESLEPRGYGLANVKAAVNQLQGMVEFHSEIGTGTVFTVYLPKTIIGGS
ncbi:sensor histidine kinase [Halobacillus shinanisalinarum]|uniref:sensor histidine kinase n=1 Tax=Halobacillus shinanisalinarum TaxID=2932258 RepID=UPI00296216EB|nr:sensor histidine kinase [Halobacillus shinanisalinarum]